MASRQSSWPWKEKRRLKLWQRTQSDVERAIFNISGHEAVKNDIQARLALHVFLFFDHRSENRNQPASRT